ILPRVSFAASAAQLPCLGKCEARSSAREIDANTRSLLFITAPRLRPTVSGILCFAEPFFFFPRSEGDRLVRSCWHRQREFRTGERCRKRNDAGTTLDGGQFARGPVACDIGEFHPRQMIVSRGQTALDFLQDFETELLAVPID